MLSEPVVSSVTETLSSGVGLRGWWDFYNCCSLCSSPLHVQHHEQLHEAPEHRRTRVCGREVGNRSGYSQAGEDCPANQVCICFYPLSCQAMEHDAQISMHFANHQEWYKEMHIPGHHLWRI